MFLGPRRVVLCLICALAWALALPGRTVGQDGAAEPWQIEGENLRGSRGGGSEIDAPVITHRGLRVAAEQGRLSADGEVVTLRGSVRIADSARTVLADEGIYRRTARILDLVGNVRGRGPEGEFEGRELTWDRVGGWFVLRGAPRLLEPDRILEAQRIESWTETRNGHALGDVRILLLADSTRLYGERAEYDDLSGITRLFASPRLVSPARDGQPELTVEADTLVFDEARRSGLALGSVRIRRGEMRASCRRARFLLDEDRLVLSGDPVTWDVDGEIRADSMVVGLAGGRADQLRAWGNVRVRYEPREKAGERNFVLGDTLVAGLADGVVRDLEVRGRAFSLYLPALREVLDGTGRNLSEAQVIRVLVRRGEAERVDLIGSARGTYAYPAEGTRRRLREPAALDSIVPAWTARAYAGPDATEPPAEPPPLEESLSALLERRAFVTVDSLATPFDRVFDERVDYQGDTIRFHVPQDRIRILGRGVLHYRESELRSGEIVYDASTGLVTALSAPELSDRASTVQGRKMTYRTDEQEGIVYRGRTEFEGGYYYGREVKKLAGDELLVRQGDYTTCDLDSAPHFHFHSDRMKLILKDKAVARPVILYLKRIPVLALPYYIFPLKHGRASGVTMPDLEVGLNRSSGRFVRNLGYYWAISDYMDARAWVDYYDRGPRLYANGEYRYKLRYVLDGSVNGSFLRQRDSFGNRKRRWSARGAHQQQLGRGASLRMSADFSSDKDYRADQDFGAGVDERLNRQLKSTMELAKSWSRVSGRINLARTEYLDETTGAGTRIQVDGPNADFTVNSGALGRAPDAAGRGGRWRALSSVTYGTGARYRTVYTRRFDGRIRARQAVQQTGSLSDNRKLGPYLRLGPSLSGSWALFGRDDLGRRWRGGAAWSGGVGAGSTLYGTFLFRSGPLAGLRHVIEPAANWRYAPELRGLTYADSSGVRRNLFPSVGGIGLSGTKASSVDLSLNQRFHAKWRAGEKVVKQENLVGWSTGTGYDLLAKKRPGAAKARRWSTINNSLSVRPHRLIEATASARHSPYTRAPLSFDLRTGTRISSALFGSGASDTSRAAPGLQYGQFGEADLRGAAGPGARGGRSSALAAAPPAGGTPWDLSLSYNFSRTRGRSARASNTLNSTFSVQPTGHWRVSSSLYLDLRKREVISHSFSLYRDLHCWEFRLEHRTSGSRAEYYFRINVKQIQEVQYQRESR